MDFVGRKSQQYDQVIGSMGFKPGGPGAPGAFGHWVTKTDTGIRVTDVDHEAGDSKPSAPSRSGRSPPRLG